jgi:excisionase family DNA binding protein
MFEGVDMPTRPTMLTVEELAQRWGIHAKTLYLEIQRGRLHAVRLGRVLRVPIAVVESFEQGRVAPRGGAHGGATR